MIKSKLFNFLSLSWVVIILSQFLRHQYSLVYFPIFGSFLIFNIYLIIKQGFIFSSETYLRFHLWVFYILVIYISAMTFFYGTLNDFFTAFPRMTFMPITLIFLYNFILNKHQFYRILNVYVFFGFLGAISILYQVYFGQLDFLVEQAIRLELARYSSTMGSLTAYGGASGIILTLILTRYNEIKFSNIILACLVSLAALITLSRAGFMNIILATLILIFFHKLAKKFWLIFTVILIILVLYFVSDDLAVYLNASYENLHITSKGYEPRSLKVQLWDRIFRAPIKLAEHSIWNNFFGFGLMGGQGAFGLPFSPSGTTHNQYTEFFNIGGVILFLNVISILICLMIKLNKLRKKDHLANIFFLCNLIALINMFFFNGFLYSPSTSFVLWLSIVYVLNEEKKLNEKNL